MESFQLFDILSLKLNLQYQIRTFRSPSFPFSSRIQMQQHYTEKEQNQFNDYIVAHKHPPYKLLSSHQRYNSSGSIYYQNSFSRKKLTVTSRDNSRNDFKGDYMMPQNNNSLYSTQRTKIQNLAPNNNHALTDSCNSQRNNDNLQNLSKSSIQRNKLKRTSSPYPMTPTKVLKLKKSIVKQGNQSSNLLLHANQSGNKLVHTEERSHSHKRYESYNPSPLKNALESNRQLFLPNQAHIICHNSLQALKKEMALLLNSKISQFQSKVSLQNQTIKQCQKTIQQNYKRLREKQKVIQQLKLSQHSTKNPHQHPKCNQEAYILKRIKDLQIKMSSCMQPENDLKSLQEQVDEKLNFITTFMLNFTSSKFLQIKNCVDNFLKQNDTKISFLAQSFSFIDNKLIGRTQVIRQTLADLKFRIKDIEDSWTHKETKDTTNRDKSYDDVSQTNIISNKNIRHFQNKLRQLATENQNKQNLFQRIKGQDSLDYSLTSYQQNTILNNNKGRNMYFDDNLNQMEDVSIGGYKKDESSRLTDDFFYPENISKITRENITPINKKHKHHPQRSNQYIPNQQNSIQNSKKTNFKRNQSPKSQSPVQSINIISVQQPSPPGTPQAVVKISNQAINKKIDSIRQLIDEKKTSSSSDILKSQLGCFVDKSGYLKYTDSKTFVFDGKGNLITCTEGQYWFLVTKGLIYGKRDDDQSRTMSFIQFDQ